MWSPKFRLFDWSSELPEIALEYAIFLYMASKTWRSSARRGVLLATCAEKSKDASVSNITNDKALLGGYAPYFHPVTIRLIASYARCRPASGQQVR